MEKQELKGVESIVVRENSLGEIIFSLESIKVRPKKGLFKQIGINKLKKQFLLKGAVFASKTFKKNYFWAEPFLEEKIYDTSIRFGVDSFFQVNIELLHRLVADILRLLPWQDMRFVADLYCGVGTFGLILAKKFTLKTVGVEIDKNNISFLNSNIENNNILNFDVLTGSAGRVIANVLRKSPDVVIVDPPRKGLGIEICKKMLRYCPPFIIYISCSPASFLRDLKILTSKYKIKDIILYDFFPHTPHIESLSILEFEG